jgi:hypothetical protein
MLLKDIPKRNGQSRALDKKLLSAHQTCPAIRTGFDLARRPIS